MGGAVGQNQLFCIFLKIDSLDFFDILHKVRGHERVYTAAVAIFRQKSHFPKKWKRGPKMGKNELFGHFRKIESLVFASNDLK